MLIIHFNPAEFLKKQAILNLFHLCRCGTTLAQTEAEAATTLG